MRAVKSSALFLCRLKINEQTFANRRNLMTCKNKKKKKKKTKSTQLQKRMVLNIKTWNLKVAKLHLFFSFSSAMRKSLVRMYCHRAKVMVTTRRWNMTINNVLFVPFCLRSKIGWPIVMKLKLRSLKIEPMWLRSFDQIARDHFVFVVFTRKKSTDSTQSTPFASRMY